MFALAYIVVGVLAFALWKAIWRECASADSYQDYPELSFDEKRLVAQYASTFSWHETFTPVSAQFFFRMGVPIREENTCDCHWKYGTASTRVIKIACSAGVKASKYLNSLMSREQGVIFGFKDGGPTMHAIMDWYREQQLPLPELSDGALNWALRARGPSMLRVLLEWAPEHKKVKPTAGALVCGHPDVVKVLHENMYQVCGGGAALKIQILVEHGRKLKQALACPADAATPVYVPPREREDTAAAANAEQARVLASGK